MPEEVAPPPGPAERHSPWYALLLLLVVLPVAPLLLQRGMLLQHDIFASDLLHNQFPYRAYAGRHLANGEFPLWMPDLFSGLPYLAQIEAGPLFLPNLLLFGLLEPHVALNLSIVLTIVLGAGGAFLLARTYGADNVSASLGGLVFSLSGFNVSHVKHMNMHEAAALLPWMVLCLERALRSASGAWFVLLAVAVGLQVAAGHPQITYYSLLFLVARVVAHLARGLLPGRGSARREEPAPLARAALGSAAAVLLGLGACAVQLLTTYRFNQASIRSKPLDWSFAAGFPYHLPDLRTFFYPLASGLVDRGDYRGTVEWENYGYVGIIPLLLIALAAFRVRRPVVWFYLAALAASLVLAVGPATPLYRAAWEALPGMKLFRFPTRFLLVASLAAAMLAALGSTWLGARLRGTRRAAVVPGLLAGLFLVTYADLHYWQGMRLPMDRLDAWRSADPLAVALEARKGDGRIYALFGPEAWQSAWSASRGFRDGFERYRRAGRIPFGNLPLLMDLQSADGYTNMVEGRTASFWTWYNTNLLDRVFQPPKFDGRSGTIAPAFSSLLNVAHVRYLVSPVPLRNPEYALLLDGPVKLYENRTALPRAYLAYGWQGVGTIDEAAAWLFDRRHNAIPAIEGVPSAAPDAGGAVAGVAVRSSGTDRLEIEVRPRAEGYLVLTDSFAAGWSATVDGEPAEIRAANGYQRAVRVRADSRKVVFRYRPPGFVAGSLISIGSLLALGGWLVAGLRGRRSGIPPKPPGA